ncbi:MAG TPA: hypothetical protein IAB39_00410 [Candidatus Onthovicinus excrementipullorum]|nr:hypothetical protein [Candidatus Onthovicinus excrementipullorum]
MKKRIISLLLAVTMAFGVSAGALAAEDETYEPTYEPGITHEMMDDIVTGLNGILETELWVNVIDKTVYTNYTIGLLYDASLQGLAPLGMDVGTPSDLKASMSTITQMVGRPYAAALDTIPDDVADVFARDENGVPYLTTLNYGVTDEASFWAKFNEWFQMFYDIWFIFVSETAGLTDLTPINTIWDAVNTFASDWLGLKAQIVMPAEGLVTAEAVTDFIGDVVVEVRADTAGTLLRALPLLAQDEHLQVLGTFLNAVYPKITDLLADLGVEGVDLPALSEDWVEPVADSQVPNLLYDVIAMPAEGTSFSGVEPTLAMQGLSPMLAYFAPTLLTALNVGLDSQFMQLIFATFMNPQGLNDMLGSLITDNMANPIPQTCTHRLNLEGVLNTILNEVPILPGPDGTNVPLGITLTGMDLENKLGAMATPADAGDVLKVVLDYVWAAVIVDEENFAVVNGLIAQLLPDAAGLVTGLLGDTPEARAAAKTTLIPMVASLLSGKEYDVPGTTDPTDPGTDDGQNPAGPSDGSDGGLTDGSAGDPDTGDSLAPFALLVAASAAALLLTGAGLRRRRA